MGGFLGSILSGLIGGIVGKISAWWETRGLRNEVRKLGRQNIDLKRKLDSQIHAVKVAEDEAEVQKQVTYVEQAVDEDDFIKRWKEVQKSNAEKVKERRSANPNK